MTIKNWIVLPKMLFHSNSNRTTTGCSQHLLCIIAVILLIGRVEPNSAPTVIEVSKRLDDFVISYQAVRDQFLLSVPDLSLPGWTNASGI